MNPKSIRVTMCLTSRGLAARFERSLLLGHEKMAGWLLGRAGNGLARNGQRMPPLLAAIRPGGVHKTDEIRWRLVVRLLASGADPNSSQGGITPLLLAAEHGTAEIVKILLLTGADVRARDYLGRNALHHAAEANQPAELITPLIKAGVEFDAEDARSGLTPLATYTAHHNLEACQLLLKAGADPDARLEPLDTTPREAAREIESKTMIHMLNAYVHH
jgi:ankyrin repeat protein